MASSSVSIQPGSQWNAKSVRLGSKSRRRTAGAVPGLPAWLFDADDHELEVAKVYELSPAAGRRAAGTTTVDLDIKIEGDETYFVAATYPSGAVTFHAATQATDVRRGKARKTEELHFRVPIQATEIGSDGRRGLVTKALKGALKIVAVKVIGKLADIAIEKLASAWEERQFESKEIRETLYRVTGPTLASRKLLEATERDLEDAVGKRSLLFIHGTFSDAASAFRGLANPSHDFFGRVRERYEDRIFALNHYTVSKTPMENAELLLELLPDGPFSFDVVTHSRGGLVLRSLVERSSELGPNAQRVSFGESVLVASPNQGTPLATPERWDHTLGWLSSLLDLFPDNPFTFGASLVAEGVVWLAHRITTSLPGLQSMDSGGATIAALQGGALPPRDGYSALVANHEPADRLWQRVTDLGIDGFFGSANDMVVPSEGGWIVDDASDEIIDASRIGCFGRGGNLSTTTGEDVHHINFFDFKETADFIVESLFALGHSTVGPDPNDRLPYKPGRRRSPALAAPPVPQVGKRAEKTSGHGSHDASPNGETAFELEQDPFSRCRSDRLQHNNPPFMLTLIPAEPLDEAKTNPAPKATHLLASYGGARAMETLYLREGEGGARSKELIAMDKRITAYVNGTADEAGEAATLPTDDEMIEYGKLLYRTMFFGDIERLYDAARSISGQTKLDIVFTSMVGWVADIPWEFAFDPTRKTFLATEEIQFTRNVVTAVPAERIDERRDALRILVVAAQPVGAGQLSIDEESAVIRRGFASLENAGLVEIEPLPRATPSKLHARVRDQRFDIIHFIGHGEYDQDEDRGFLLFENEDGGEHRVDDRQLREILCGRGISLVFLNACETGRGGRADFNSGVAPALVAGGLPAVVANQYSVLDASATTFAQHFYWCLAAGHNLGTAAREARIAVNYSIAGEAIDWAVPVVYARDARERLCAPRDGTSGIVVTTEGGSSARRSATRDVIPVAVWDVAYALPELDAVLERMNAVQERFEFLREEVSAPIGTWRRLESDGEKHLYVDAPQVAEKLKNKPRELGAEYLICITDYYMMDDEYLNIYGWWEEESETAESDTPVLLFSTAGLGLEPRGPSTDRAIAAEAVSLLLNRRTGVEMHTRGPKDCLFYFNEERDLALLTGNHQIDVECRRYLEETAGEDLEAAEAILRAFAD